MAVITGTPGNDTLGGTSSADTLQGLDGNDYLQARGGNDTLQGGNHDDRLEGGLGADVLDGGAGYDYAAYYYAGGGVRADLLTPASNIGDAAGESYTSIEGLIGSAFDDFLFGDNNSNDLVGLDGNDSITGRGGNDLLQGGTGADSLDGGSGADRLFGNAGADFASYASASAAVTANLAGSAGNVGEAAGDIYVGIEGLIGSSFDDTLIGDGAANVLQGSAGDDYLQGAGGADNMQGGSGTDRLEGGAGADVLNGGADFDYAAYYHAPTGVRVDLALPANDTLEAIGDTFTSVEGLIGSASNDALYGDAAGNDLAGVNGNDTINGRGGADGLQGLAGNDALNGGPGADRLIGGIGNDTFTFKRGEANGDFITDFAGNGAAAGDQLRFKGYGTAAQGASFTQLDATHWSINSADGLVHDVIGITNGAAIDPTDFFFVGPVAVNVPENTTAVTTITSNDVDVGASRSSSITGGADQAKFAIDPASGALSFLSAPDFEVPADTGANNVYDVEVSVSDGAGLVDVQAVAVTVTNVADPVALTAVAAGIGGFVIRGENMYDGSGVSVAGLGDVNGDGLADIVVGAPGASPGGTFGAGRSYVVFGRVGTTPIDLTDVVTGAGGFVINGEARYDASAAAVSAAGDVNGDGFADIVVGASGHDGRDLGSGRSYVVFGKGSTTPVDLTAVAAGAGGFVIDGQCRYDSSGASVASAGDVNGDGLADLIVGAPSSSAGGALAGGRSYVVFGQTGTNPIDLSLLAAGSGGGFAIDGEGRYDTSGIAVVGGGDVNGDGFGDLFIVAPNSSPGAQHGAGRTYVVFGRAAPGTVELSDVAAGSGGFVVNGMCRYDGDAASVGAVGDVNGDGLADLAIGNPHGDPAGAFEGGRSYIVFGRSGTAPVDLTQIAAGVGGFVINGAGVDDHSGLSIAGIGDIDGDGLADIIVGAPDARGTGDIGSGRGYVVLGRTATTGVELTAIENGIGGFVINGECRYDASAASVAAGDVNGDGLTDLIVGAPGSNSGGHVDSGRTYVIFGSTTGAFADTHVDQLGGSGGEVLSGGVGADTLVGGAGNDTLIGNGGADVLYGGAGDDVIAINASNVAALHAGFGAGGNVVQLSRVDGGAGIDTLQLSGGGLTLDLRLVANAGAGTPGSASRIESVERVDLTGSGNNTLAVSISDVLDMAGMNSYTNTGGWADGTYNLGLALEQRHQLVIDGDGGDVVSSTGWGVSVGTVTNAGHAYNVYNAGLYAQLLIDSDVTALIT